MMRRTLNSHFLTSLKFFRPPAPTCLEISIYFFPTATRCKYSVTFTPFSRLARTLVVETLNAPLLVSGVVNVC
jgi:hypothetical protein